MYIASPVLSVVAGLYIQLPLYYLYLDIPQVFQTKYSNGTQLSSAKNK